MIQTNISLNTDVIVGKLFSYHNQAHFLHLQTNSYAEHKALDNLYSSLEELKDSIAELLLGYDSPKRLGKLNIYPIDYFNNPSELVNDLFNFTVNLCEYAKSINLEELCNLASELQNITLKTKYFLTLK